MNTIFGILIVLALSIGGVSIAYLTAIWVEKERYNTYMYNGTRFFCKESPGITCYIDKVYPDDILACRLKLIVTYPSGNNCNLLTTTGAFNDIWKEFDNE